MSTEKFSAIAVLGMGTMGANLARNFAAHGIKTALWNRSLEKAAFVAGENPLFSVAVSLNELPRMLEPPRKVLMMLPAGDPTEKTAENLKSILRPGDIVINGANSTAEDSDAISRSLAEKNILYLGLGISGGEKGALEGPAFMAGGSQKAWEHSAPILLKCAADAPEGGKCAAYFGEGGAGHLVKTLHNGIEYAQMEIIAEVCDLLRTGFGALPPATADFLAEESAKQGFRSFLTDLTVNIMQEENPDGSGWLINDIADSAGGKGTGLTCLQYALQSGFPVPAMTQALMMRQLSTSLPWRKNRVPAEGSSLITAASLSAETLGRGMKAALIEAFAEGIALLEILLAARGIVLDKTVLAKTWSNGCIIRSELLEIWKNSTSRRDDNIIFPPEVDNILFRLLPSWQQLAATAAKWNLPMPAVCAGWEYYLLSAKRELPTALTAAQRDAFGNHLFKRKSSGKNEHHKWRMPR